MSMSGVTTTAAHRAPSQLHLESESSRYHALRQQGGLSRFLHALKSLPSIRTSYGDRLTVFRGHVSERHQDEATARAREAFGEPVSRCGEIPSAAALEQLRMGLSIYQGSTYYLTRSTHGTNIMEARPWGSGGCGFEICHIPENHIPGTNRDHHTITSIAEYRTLMLAASAAQDYELDAKLLVDIVASNNLREEMWKVFLTEWKLLAGPSEKTPMNYKRILDRIDPLFRLSSQPLYARRQDYGICLGVWRQHAVDQRASIVIIYIPDHFRFMSSQTQGTTGLLGILSKQCGLNIPEDLIEGLIPRLKEDL